jgi:hypothetical protein
MVEKTLDGNDDCAKMSPAGGNAIALNFLHDSESNTTYRPARSFSIMTRSADEFDIYITETNKGIFIFDADFVICLKLVHEPIDG